MNHDNITIYGTGKNTEKFINFYADKDLLLNNYDIYEDFIKGCEHCVRTDDRYKTIISKLKEAGLTKCAILGNITEDDKVKLEMHHGPIFNLFDICDIVTRACLNRNYPKLTTYDIGDIVLSEHEDNNIMVVMLSKTAHKSDHNKDARRSIFVNIKATVGRIDHFIDHWSDGMEKEHWFYIEKYIKECEKANASIDNGLFDTAEHLKEFK